MRVAGYLAVSAVLFAACAEQTPEMQLIAAAADAMGGERRLQQVDTLVVEGDGESFWLGENPSPDAALPSFFATYRWLLDWSNTRYRFEELRTPRFPTSNPSTQRIVTALDDAVAYDVDPLDKAIRQPDRVGEERRALLIHHPIGSIRAAYAPGTTLENLRTHENYDVIDIVQPGGSRVSLFVDRQSKLPARVESEAHQLNLGDVILATEFASYRDVDGVRLPSQITWRLDGEVLGVLREAITTINGDVGRLEVPRLVRDASPDPPPQVVTEQLIGEGLWRLEGGAHFSALAEFNDHLVLIDIPLGEARALALFAKAKELRPDKPLTHVVVTHHHFDHAAGLRAAVAEGLTVIVHQPTQDTGAPSPGGGARTRFMRGTREFFQELLERKHTLAPDLLARSPRSATFELVEDAYVMEDDTNRMEVYPIEGSAYADTVLMAYFPREKVLVEVDVYTPHEDPLARRDPIYPFARNLLENIQRRELDVERIVPLHSRIVTLADLEKNIREHDSWVEFQ